jgi:hypothetical protein
MRPGNDDVLAAHDRAGSKTAAAGAEAARVQAAYRELRKSFEDAKKTNQGRRTSTTAKWRCAGWPAGPDAIASSMHRSPRTGPVSGYRLRASRALLTLLLVLAVATVLFATVGFGHTQQIV